MGGEKYRYIDESGRRRYIDESEIDQDQNPFSSVDPSSLRKYISFNSQWIVQLEEMIIEMSQIIDLLDQRIERLE